MTVAITSGIVTHASTERTRRREAGIYRVFNDKHWVGDIVAGAGIGILSTEIAYWLFPLTSKWFSSKEEREELSVVPFYQSKTVGLTIIKTF